MNVGCILWVMALRLRNNSAIDATYVICITSPYCKMAIDRCAWHSLAIIISVGVSGGDSLRHVRKLGLAAQMNFQLLWEIEQYNSTTRQWELFSVAAHTLALTGDASLYFVNSTIMTVKSLVKIYLRQISLHTKKYHVRSIKKAQKPIQSFLRFLKVRLGALVQAYDIIRIYLNQKNVSFSVRLSASVINELCINSCREYWSSSLTCLRQLVIAV